MTKKIYTKTGDKGQSSFFGPGRELKNHPRFCAYGSVDELNSSLGCLVAHLTTKHKERVVLEKIQHRLFNIGSHLSCTDKKLAQQLPAVNNFTALLESSIDEMEKELPTLKNFILPGGTTAAAMAHMARTQCRKTERELVAFFSDVDFKNGSDAEYELKEVTLSSINRLSDYLFVLARLLNFEAGYTDKIWLTENN